MIILVAIWVWLTTPSPSAQPVDFQRDVRPILEHCQPCHFPGGKVYQKMPFDRPETVVRLGTKLFTRIHDEKQRAIIRQFLAGTPASSPAGPPPSRPRDAAGPASQRPALR